MGLMRIKRDNTCKVLITAPGTKKIFKKCWPSLVSLFFLLTTLKGDQPGDESEEYEFNFFF